MTTDLPGPFIVGYLLFMGLFLTQGIASIWFTYLVVRAHRVHGLGKKFRWTALGPEADRMTYLQAVVYLKIDRRKYPLLANLQAMNRIVPLMVLALFLAFMAWQFVEAARLGA